MLDLKHIDVQFSDHTLFSDANFTLYAGQKYGVVGRNGAGKTTFFSLIQKTLSPDGGEVVYNDRLHIASVTQEIDRLDLPAIDYVIESYPIIGKLWLDMKAFEQSEDYEKLADVHMQLAEHKAYDIEALAAKILHGLGFAQDELQQTVGAFSGGWRVRLNLARCLIQPAELMLLDEPTNHLDMDAIIWLQDWLKSYSGSLMVISHDRYFLDQVTEYTLAIEQKKLIPYKGGYSQYEQEKVLKAELAEKQAKKQAKQREHLQSFVDRFRAKASKAKQAQSRMKMLEKLPTIALAQADSPYRIQFFESEALSNPVLKLENFSFAYDEAPVFNKANFGLNQGDRLGLLGLNGAGKSTLVKLMAAQLQAQRGERIQSAKLNIGYFAQHQVEHLKLEESAYQHLQRLAPGKTASELRGYLGGFHFSGDKALQKVESFSGGEKARLALALIIWQRPNLLLLDEPTNHLDMDMREALTIALQDYDGVLILVSHDRHLLEATVDQFYLVDGGQVARFEGDLDDYANWSKQRREIKPKSSPKPNAKAAVVDSKAIARIEKDIEKATDALAKIDQAMSALAQDDFDAMAKLAKERKALENQLAKLEEAWLEAQ
ncbi:MAG: ABC transporter ATP-binding protein [Gammaproteobacteria bacterium CG11_big_fil_rev_8_21_14_0_20_46_22]|nr:MAG: ABC transporter ATP-binding protein [Gammaproteobacteria bacterium CG12_big_fil_rev_8_21_14_0_65_46_12]PIR11017.1 MAG: ABC transporter ATP-binding protein [Gammaproteobacteria bacterium CG11_big_fil_rev_8_21_14_0_20_46_22]